MKNKIRVAYLYNPNDPFISGDHYDNDYYYFYMHALKRNNRLDVSYFPESEEFDTTKLKGKYDIILTANHPSSAPKELKGIKEVGIPVIAKCGDLHFAKRYQALEYHEKYNIAAYYNLNSENYFYKFYPKHFKYKVVIMGMEPKLYQKVKPFKERIRERILVSGAMGKNKLKSRIANRVLNPRRSSWYFYKLRTKCKELPYVDFKGMKGNKFVNDDYVNYLSSYRASIAATTWFPSNKYFASTACGCMTFMEITKENYGEYLGYKDGESAVFINEKNYKKKFEEYLNDPNNLKWEEIANAGREHTINELNNDKAVESLIQLMEEFV